MTTEPRFEIIMPCWILNEELLQLTKNAVESLSGPDVDFIIVDNGSTMGGGYLRSIAKTYIRNNENLGYSKAVNQGLMLAHLGNYFVIANNDIRVSPNWREVTRKELEGHDEIYTLHYRMIYYDAPMDLGSHTYYGGKERWTSASLFTINRDQQVFLYDENYGKGGYEDYDCWQRVKRAGLKQAYTTKACFQHKDSSTQNLMDQTERSKEDARRREYFKSKFGEYPDVLFAKDYPEQMLKDWRAGYAEL